MAIVKGGFLGDLSGSVGNVTFARARGGIHTARIRVTPVNPRTQAQQQQRGRFKQLQQFTSAFLEASGRSGGRDGADGLGSGRRPPHAIRQVAAGLPASSLLCPVCCRHVA